MRSLINERELQGILQRGLIGGCWSVRNFNPPGHKPILPSPEFLEAHPQFEDMNFRDLEAFNKARQLNRIVL